MVRRGKPHEAYEDGACCATMIEEDGPITVLLPTILPMETRCQHKQQTWNNGKSFQRAYESIANAFA